MQPYTGEINPIKPDLPQGAFSKDQTRFLRELIESLRAQHNATQRGDSTYPVKFLQEPFLDSQGITLGAEGRFISLDQGLVRAVWLQIESLSGEGDFLWPTNQVYRVSNKRPSGFLGLPLGLIQCSLPSPSFLWAMTKGANVSPVSLSGTSVTSFGSIFVGVDGGLTTDAEGLCVGYVLDSEGVDAGVAAPGSIWIDLMSRETGAAEGVALRLDELEERITTLEEAEDPNPTAPEAPGDSGLGLVVAQLQRQVSGNYRSLDSRIVALEGAGVGGLQSRIETLELRVEEGLTQAGDAAALINLSLATLSGSLNPIQSMIMEHEEAIAFLKGAVTRLSLADASKTFLGLLDAPTTYAASAGLIVRVKGDESGLEFAALEISDVTGLAGSLALIPDLSGGYAFAGPVEVPDEAYGPSWDGSTQVPTKGALYDIIETLV